VKSGWWTSAWSPRFARLCCLHEPADDELDLVTVLLHTTALRGNRWELNLPKLFLRPGAFHLQQIQSISAAKLERKLGALTPPEIQQVEEALVRRLAL
jgi:mRNA-degrading endonuclease toxin of MazEF toxin-antitoxin module